MPSWLIKILVNIAINVGVPWLIKKFPGIPKEVLDIINTLIDGLKETPDKMERRELKKNAKECVGVACATRLTK